MKTIYAFLCLLPFTVQAEEMLMPGAPTELKSTLQTTSTLTLSWTDNAGNETGFHVYRSVDGSAGARVGSTERNVTEFTDRNLEDNRTYYYYVTAFDSQGQTQASNTFAAKTLHAKFSLRGRVVDADYFPIAGARVKLNGPDGFDVSQEVRPNLPIRDNTTIEAPIAVTGAGNVQRMEVGLDIRHTYIGDLTVSLIHPDGTTVVLHAKSGGGSDNLNVFYPRTATPAQALTAFNGKAIAGAWKLKVTDSDGSDIGTLDKVVLKFQSTQRNPAYEAVTGADGAYVIPEAFSGAYKIEALKDGYRFPNSPRDFLLNGNKNQVHFVAE